MSYAPKRPSISQKRRHAIFDRDHGICYLCGLPISDGESYDLDHELSRELGGSDMDNNLRPAHRTCHRRKSKLDVAAIAKSNRIRRANGPTDERRKSKKPLRSRPFQQRYRPLQSRNTLRKQP